MENIEAIEINPIVGTILDKYQSLVTHLQEEDPKRDLAFCQYRALIHLPPEFESCGWENAGDLSGRDCRDLVRGLGELAHNQLKEWYEMMKADSFLSFHLTADPRLARFYRYTREFFKKTPEKN